MLLDTFTSQFSPATFATALAATAAVRIYERRPRGFLNPSIRLLVQKSQVPGGGLGVYVEDTLPAGTQLGADKPAGLKAMQEKFGLYCVPPSALRAEGILLENMIAYANSAPRAARRRRLRGR